MLGKDFNEADKEDIVEVIRRIEARRIFAWTKHDYRAALKKLYKWLKGGGEEYSEEVKWASPTVGTMNARL